MIEQRTYKYNRVLIEAERVLDSQFSDTVLEVSGAQLELLRNMTQYLRRRTTFVDTYHTGYYEEPNDEDWDEILAIVADLEEELMGNENTVFGFHDRYIEFWSNSSHAAGVQLLETMPVPAGYVYVVELAYMIQGVQSGSYQHLVASNDTNIVYIEYWPAYVAGIPITKATRVVLAEDDYIRATWGDTGINEYIAFGVWGYKMKL